ncbi:Protein RDR1 [Talaromyces islandicus]|uniref:Protein RDR1 n=1 Tax=Talaromyces islandicus TaxID=28573 RepID=A0A0U1M8Q4_TALIS|nr:Protein RDR1 [Talaromyces islandicus]
MSTTTGKRKRARKACIPCHQRKRKCDGEYPCDTCVTFNYNCRYADDAVKSRSPDSQPHIMRAPHEAEVTPSSKSPDVRTGIFDEQKSRYTGASAAMAFPHILGVAFGSDSPPKINSFAYNFGIRPEEASNVHGVLGKLISENDLAFYSNVYFSIMSPISDYMDPRIYAQRCQDYYQTPGNTSLIFGAVAAGVAALGSFLSPTRYPRESDLVQYAKAILDDPASIRMLSIDHIIAWAMRVFYLRATTRPSNAWIASCTAMHLCEMLGLHEEENINRMASAAGAAVLGHDADRLRRIFWISWAGHNILSYEYDRSAVRFAAVTCQPIIPIHGSVADQFVRIVQIIPVPDSPFQLNCQPQTQRDELFERLNVLSKFHFTHPFLVVTKADLAFCFYRRIYQLKTGITDDIIQLIIDSGNDAVKAAEQLANQGRLFWNVIGSVFQYACVLLGIDTPASSAHIPTAFQGLENLVKAADTGLTRQALSVARHLLSLNIAKKRKELTQLEAVEAGYEPFQVQNQHEVNAAFPDMNWGMDWDQFPIEPYLSIFGPDIQLYVLFFSLRHDFWCFGLVPLHKIENQSHNYTQAGETDTHIKCAPVAILPSIIGLSLDRPSKPEPNGDGVVDKGVDQRRRKTLMLLRHNPVQDYGAGREGHVHTSRENDTTPKGLGQIDLVDWKSHKNDDSDKEEGPGDGHHGRSAEMGQAKTCGNGSAKSTYGYRSELARCEQRNPGPQELDDIPGDEGVSHPLLGEDEGDEDDDANNHGAVGVSCWPADSRAMVPGEVEKDQGGHAGNGTEDINTLADGKASEGRPQAAPDVTANEKRLMAEDIVKTACYEYEGTYRGRVACGEPAQLGSLSEELGGVYDRDEEDSAGEGLESLDFGCRGLELMIFDVDVVDIVG